MVLHGWALGKNVFQDRSKKGKPNDLTPLLHETTGHGGVDKWQVVNGSEIEDRGPTRNAIGQYFVQDTHGFALPRNANDNLLPSEFCHPLLL